MGNVEQTPTDFKPPTDADIKALIAKHGERECRAALKSTGLENLDRDPTPEEWTTFRAALEQPKEQKSELHKAALDYATQGWPVFPCEAGTKKPATDHGFKDATTDPTQIEAWWTENPNYNVAFEPEQAGLALVDADTYHEGCNVAALDLPDTYEVATPRGGTHFYFVGSVPTTVGDEKKPDKGLGPHIDTRGRGSYALLPPSIVEGKRYEVKADRSIVALPVEIEAKLAPRAEPMSAAVKELDLSGNIIRARTHLETQVKNGRLSIIGKRGHDTCYEVACELVRDLGLSSGKALELMLETWYPHCTPNDQPEFVRERVLSAVRNGQNEPGAFAVEPPDVAFKDANLPALSAHTTINGATYQRPADMKEDQWRSVQWHLALMAGTRPIDDIDLPAPEFYDDAKLLQKDPEGYVALIQGKKGSMKTYVTLSYLIKLAVEKGLRVSYFAGEGSYGVRTTRVQAIAKGHGISIENLSKYWITNRSAPNLFDTDSQVALMLLLENQKPNIVVIDTLGQASPGQDLNAPGFGTQLTQATKAIRQRLKCCVILIHHLGKNEKRGALGSTMIIADPGTILEVRGIAGHKELREIWVHHVREGEAERSLGFRIQKHLSLKNVSAPVPMQISDEEILTAKAKLVPPNPLDGKLAELGARIATILQVNNIRDEDDGLFDDDLTKKLVAQHQDKDVAARLGLHFLEPIDRINDKDFHAKEQKIENQEGRYMHDLEVAAGKPSRAGRLRRMVGERNRPGTRKPCRCWYLPATELDDEEQSDD